MAKSKYQFGPFEPTKYNTAADKLKFANQFVRFVEGGFKQTMFPKWFYQRLSMMFGHIAHFNQGGFYEVWFSTKGSQLRFLSNALVNGGYGSPAFTYSDVERELKEWIIKSGIGAKMEAELAEAY